MNTLLRKSRNLGKELCFGMQLRIWGKYDIFLFLSGHRTEVTIDPHEYLHASFQLNCFLSSVFIPVSLYSWLHANNSAEQHSFSAKSKQKEMFFFSSQPMVSKSAWPHLC